MLDSSRWHEPFGEYNSWPFYTSHLVDCCRVEQLPAVGTDFFSQFKDFVAVGCDNILFSTLLENVTDRSMYCMKTCPGRHMTLGVVLLSFLGFW